MDLRASPGAAQPASTDIIESSTQRFGADVIEASRTRPVLVDFWAPWCGPCKQLTPALERVIAAFKGKVGLVKVNVDENQALAGQLGVQSIPTVFGFVAGRPVDGFMGAVPESEITRFVERLLEAAQRAGVGGPDENEQRIAQALEAGEAALGAGDLERASQIFTLVLQHAPDSIKALVGLATVMVESGDIEGAKDTLAMLPEDAKSPEAESLLKTIALAEQAAQLGDAAPLEAQLAADPDDHEARFKLAMILNGRGERLAAAQALIAIMERDREWDDDGARKKLLELFEAWGPKDPATLKGRRLLSSLLFR